MKAKEESNNEVSAGFHCDVKFIYQDFDTDTNICQSFKNTKRMFIVDHILNNMSFDPLKGIVMMMKLLKKTSKHQNLLV